LIRLPFKNTILSSILKKRINQIRLVNKKPFETQKRNFKYLINKGENTKFGSDHFFQKIKNYTDFSDKIPVRNYEDLFPYIEEIRSGGENILWPGETKLFAKSSGTTNAKSKFIPLSKDALYNCHYKGGKDMLALYLNNNIDSKMFNGKGIVIGGSQNIGTKFTDGDLSAILINNFPFWVNMHRVPDIKTAIMRDWNKKLAKITHQSIKKNITSLSGVPSWMLILLNNIIETTGANNISEIWPNLELYMHGGINFSPYQNQFNKLIPSNKMHYLETYNASEGFFAIQDQVDKKDMLLMLDYGIFYEFIKKEDFYQNSYNTITLENTEAGTDYAIVITTNSGLWRYLIGDIIEFTSLNPYRIKIKGRTTSCINTFGEELMVSNTDYAIKIACQETNCELVDYTVAPIYINKKAGAHEWLIEFHKQPNSIDIFKKILDLKLKEVNSDYEAKRFNNLIIKEPKIKVMSKGVFYKWLEKNKKLGGQNKIVRLSEDRKLLEELKQINNVSFQQ
tara:strand:- start:13510 stop:15033 length:1524 start_codon:yes stop_codon:yes gene_type:complete